MLHSGSRGVGNAIGNHFIELAKKDAERNMHQSARQGSGVLLRKVRSTSVITCAIVSWAQKFAMKNRG